MIDQVINYCVSFYGRKGHDLDISKKDLIIHIIFPYYSNIA